MCLLLPENVINHKRQITERQRLDSIMFCLFCYLIHKDLIVLWQFTWASRFILFVEQMKDRIN